MAPLAFDLGQPSLTISLHLIWEGGPYVFFVAWLPAAASPGQLASHTPTHLVEGCDAQATPPPSTRSLFWTTGYGHSRHCALSLRWRRLEAGSFLLTCYIRTIASGCLAGTNSLPASMAVHVEPHRTFSVCYAVTDSSSSGSSALCAGTYLLTMQWIISGQTSCVVFLYVCVPISEACC